MQGLQDLLPGTPSLRFENAFRCALVLRFSKVASTNEFDAATMGGRAWHSEFLLRDPVLFPTNWQDFQIHVLSQENFWVAPPRKPPVALVNQYASQFHYS